MLKTEKITIPYKEKQIKLLIQMDLPESGYSDQELDEELKGVLIMQIQGNKKDLLPIMYDEPFRKKVKEILTTLTKNDIIHLPNEAWPKTWNDWETII